MSYFEISTLLPASPKRVYSAWLDSRQVSEAFGGIAHVEPTTGGKFSARDGYVEGYFMALKPYREIVQNWRTPDLPARCPDSMLTLMLQPEASATRLTIEHVQVPDHLASKYMQAWVDDYLEAMWRYFAKG